MDPFVSSVLSSVIVNAVFAAICELHKNIQKQPDYTPTKQDISASMLALPVQVARDFEIDNRIAEQLRLAIGNSPTLQNHISKYLQYYAAVPTSSAWHLDQAISILNEIVINAGISQTEIKNLFEAYLRETLLLIREEYGELLVVEEHKHIIELVSKLTADLDQRRFQQLIPYILIGRWKCGLKGDAQLLEKLGADDDPERYPTASQNRDETIFRLYDDIWDIPFREIILPKIMPFLTYNTISQFELISLEVLSELDPSLVLPVVERYLAGAKGLLWVYSMESREGIAEGLLLFKRFECIEIPGLRGKHITLRSFINGIIAQLLDLSGWENWASLGHVLPILAEVAPDVFLRKLEKSLETGDDGVLRLFSEGGGSFGSNPHVDLLWALERIAWLPDCFIRAVLLLAELAQTAPKTKISNNPSGSLMSIFRPVLSQTIASEEQKTDALELLVERYPEVARYLLLSMIPSRGSIILNSNNRPQSLSGYEHPDKDGINSRRLWNMVNNAVEILLSGTYGCDVLADLIKEIPNLQHPSGREAILNSLRRLSLAEDESSGSSCWNALREVLHWQEIRKKAAKDIPEEILKKLHEHYEKLTPDDLVARYSWLFSSYPRPPFDIGETDPKKDERIIALRESAISDILSNSEWQTVLLELIDSIKTPYKIGELLGETALEEDIGKRIKRIPLDGNPQREQFFYSFMRFRLKHDNQEEYLVKAESQYAEDDDFIRFAITLSTLEPIVELWDKIASYDDDIESEYWNRFPSSSLDSNEPELIYALKKLIEFHKYPGAILMLSHSLHYHKPVGGLPAGLAEIIDAILDKLDQEDVLKEITAISYEIRDLLENLVKYNFDSERIFRLEMKLFYLLERSGYSFPGLSKCMIENPDEFVEIVKWVYKSEEDETGRELDDEGHNRAEFGFRFLHEWNGIPGYMPDELNDEYLRSWISRVIEVCLEIGRGNIVLYEIARILKRIPSGSEETTLHEAVRDIIQNISSSTLDEAMMIEIMNVRGTWTKKLGEGGEQERKLAERFRDEASLLSTRHNRTKDILERVAKKYEEDAKRENIRAEKYLGE